MEEITPTLVIAIIALISPVITNWMNNRHLEREKALDFTNKHSEKLFDRKMELIGSFLEATYVLKQHLESAKIQQFYSHKTLIGTIEDVNNPELVSNPQEFKAAILTYTEKLAQVLTVVEQETANKLIAFNEKFDDGNNLSVSPDIDLSDFSDVIDLLRKEINTSKPNYDQYRPKKIKEVFLGFFKHIGVTEKGDQN